MIQLTSALLCFAIKLLYIIPTYSVFSDRMYAYSSAFISQIDTASRQNNAYTSNTFDVFENR